MTSTLVLNHPSSCITSTSAMTAKQFAAAASTAFLPPPTLQRQKLNRHQQTTILQQEQQQQKKTLIPPPQIPIPVSVPSFYQQLGLDDIDDVESTSNFVKKTQFPRVVGHRGAPYDAFENTLQSFDVCAQAGIWAVELDVFWLPRDGSLVVFHGGGNDECPGDLYHYFGDIQQGDNNNKKKSILDCTYDELQQLTFNPPMECEEEFPALNNNKSSMKETRIPLLKTVLLHAKQFGYIVKIELKGPHCTIPVLKLVEELDMVSQCQFSSFRHERLATIRQLHTERDSKTGRYVYQTGALYGKPLEPNDDETLTYLKDTLGVSQVHLRFDHGTADVVSWLQKAGLETMVYLRGPKAMRDMIYSDVGNEDEEMYRALIRAGANEICCNRPLLLQTIISKRQQGEREKQQQQSIIMQ